MKKIVVALLMITVCLSSVVCFACEPVKYAGHNVLNIKMTGATINYQGESKAFTDDSQTITAYSEWNKNTIIAESYERVQFYLQLSSNSSSKTKYGYVRVQTSCVNGASKTNFNEYTYNLNKGDDAVFCDFDFTGCNNLYIIFRILINKS